MSTEFYREDEMKQEGKGEERGIEEGWGGGCGGFISYIMKIHELHARHHAGCYELHYLI